MRKVVLAVPAALLVLTAAACSGTSKATPAAARRAAPPASAITAPRPGTSDPPPSSADPTTSSTEPTSSTELPTSTTTVAPPLPVPSPIPPLASPAVAGEGSWRPAGDRLPGGYAVYTTQLRAGPGLPYCGVAWIDTGATRLSLYAGQGQPYGSWPQQAFVGPTQQPALMAAFNSGFNIYSYRTGWYDQGRVAEPLQSGAASLVIYSNGTATVGDWGRDFAMGPTVTAVRQNLTLLVDGGKPTAASQDPSQWGAVLGGGYVTWRSALGVSAAGDLVYAGGPSLTPAELANVMVAAGAERAMEMDINPEWVSFSSFTHPAGPGGAVTGTNLLQGMYYSPYHYLQTYTRDFVAVFSR